MEAATSKGQTKTETTCMRHQSEARCHLDHLKIEEKGPLLDSCSTGQRGHSSSTGHARL